MARRRRSAPPEESRALFKLTDVRREAVRSCLLAKLVKALHLNFSP